MTNPTPVPTDAPGPAHAPRRSPSAVDEPLDLREAGAELLEAARGLDAGRSARTLTPGTGQPVKQVLLALLAGRRMDDHVAPGPTTLHGITGRVLVHHDGATISLEAGKFVPCPTTRHSVEALDDAVFLLTVAPARAGQTEVTA